MGRDWYRVEGLSATDLEHDRLKEGMAGMKRIGLLRRHDTIHAFSATCPHAGASLCEGWLDALGRIVCPLHHHRYDPANGRNTSGEGYKLMTYPVEIRENSIFVAF